DIFPLWFQLVTIYNIKGKRTHDIRLLAVMKASNITHLLTFNPDDFIRIPNITIVHPQDFINSQ
ncbi:MAG: PIN domain nuclease, partial [Microcystis sp. M53603_WE2]|nr:PIN domain nuclease [Microcystis sp. M53603_WE2]